MVSWRFSEGSMVCGAGEFVSPVQGHLGDHATTSGPLFGQIQGLHLRVATATRLEAEF